MTKILFLISVIANVAWAGKPVGKEKFVIYPVKHITVSINRSPAAVYEFIANPENLPQWAQGLSRSSIVKSGDSWIADSPMGKVKIKFAEKNNFGVVDHDVTLPSGEVNHNPMRVVPNGQGSEVLFTLFRLPKASDKDFNEDAKMVEGDLQRLKALLEK
ncbi:SRPBCC family protein [Bdellovibrio sp. HCB2-146]|uniref:SRPBCC family protein n=1 Tax=Bdellovibrio sp. HCB2-146 TaxID=3394362 RepID=UPI0039BC93D0